MSCLARASESLLIFESAEVEGPASGRRAQFAAFFAKLLQPELSKDLAWAQSTASKRDANECSIDRKYM